MDEILAELDAEDWAFVEGVWKTINSLWPKIEALEKRATGVAPPKVPPMKTIRKLKTGEEIVVDGGYYPLVYDHVESDIGRRQATQDIEKLPFEAGYVRAMTPHGHVIARVENFNSPLSLDLDVVTRHLTQVIHDIAFREAVHSVYKILTDNDIRFTMIEHLGEGHTAQFMEWLKRLANDRQGIGDPFINSFLGKARMNATIVAMAFKGTVTMQNLANYVNVLEKVRPHHLATALGGGSETGTCRPKRNQVGRCRRS